MHFKETFDANLARFQNKMGSKWDEVDPRVEWAMKLFDQEGQAFEAEMERIIVPTTLAVTPVGSMTLMNWIQRTPLKSNLLPAIALAPLGFWLGQKYDAYQTTKRATNNAAIKHYVMTHPELFPEPKRVKYIDAIQPFYPIRR